MKFHEILNKYIKLIGCTQKNLSEKSNISESIISKYKNNKTVPDTKNLIKLANSLEELSNNKYKEKDILEEFNKSVNTSDIDFKIVVNNLNTLINSLNINVSTLSKNLNYDASYISRIRSNKRIPSNKEKFIDLIIKFILKNYNNEKYIKILTTTINNNIINHATLKEWLINNDEKEEVKITDFLKTLNDFDLNDFIKTIKFDKLKVPSIPFYKLRSKNYYGIEEMKKGELDFFKGTVLSKSKDDIFMCSDMPMEDMAKDIEFGKKWMFAIALCLKKGLHLNIIHNLDRPFNEMMLGLQSWIPIYMTGQVSPYYLKDLKNTIYYHINYTSGTVALTGECIKNSHNKGKYYITTNTKELNYYKEKSKLILKKASSLMDIYKKENINNFKKFIEKDYNIKANRKRIYKTLPLFTINNHLLIKILKRNNLNEEEIENILNYKKLEEQNTISILKENKIEDIIYKIDKEEKINLPLENIFIDKEITYTYQEYLSHYNDTINYNNKNYKVTINNAKNFDNMNIIIVENNYVCITKISNPIIHFVIRHPKLIDAISNFNPLVKE